MEKVARTSEEGKPKDRLQLDRSFTKDYGGGRNPSADTDVLGERGRNWYMT